MTWNSIISEFFSLYLTDRNTSVLRYCPVSDTWSVFHSCSAHVRKQQMLSVEDTIYLVGGYTHELEPAETGRRRLSHTEDMLTVQSYNVQTGELLQLKENTSKSGLNLTCTLHNDGIYIMSRDVSLPTSLEHRVFLKYNIFSDAWEAFRRFPALGQNMLLCSLYLPNVLWGCALGIWRRLQTAGTHGFYCSEPGHFRKDKDRLTSLLDQNDQPAQRTCRRY